MSTTPKPKRRRPSDTLPDANPAVPMTASAPSLPTPTSAQATPAAPPTTSAEPATAPLPVGEPLPVGGPAPTPTPLPTPGPIPASAPPAFGTPPPAAPAPAAPPAATVPIPPAPAPASYIPAPLTRPRVGGIVWGVIVTVLGLGVALVGFRRTTLDLDVLAIIALFAIGAILLVGALAAAIRGRSKSAASPTNPPAR